MNGNAIIKSTMLGIEDHGIMICYLNLEQDGYGQGFGGYVLDGPYNDTTRQREPNKVCGFFIKRIMETVGVSKWEDLVGKYARVIGEDFGEIHGIGNIIEDKWFYPKEEIKELECKEDSNEEVKT